MNKQIRLSKIQNNLFIYGTPTLLVFFILGIINSDAFSANAQILSQAITIDLLFTIPLIHFLLIRKKKNAKVSILSFLIIGLGISSFIIPKENQVLLDGFKTWIFPVVELSVVTYVIYRVRKTTLKLQQERKKQPDFFSALKQVTSEILPKKIGLLLAMEIAVFYYGFIYWKKRTLNKNEFSYHKNSGTIGLFIALIGIISIETYVLHLLLLKWSAVAAWIVTGLSIYSTIQILGFVKSITKRPIYMCDDTLYLRYGILAETTIPLDNIISIELSSKDIDSDTKKLSPLGGLDNHNVIITLKEENTLAGLYGMQKTYTKLAFFVDDKERFKEAIKKETNQR